jgi:phosphate acyltransferase
MVIGIDIMGGDYAPEEAIKGIQLYLAETTQLCRLCLIGNKETTSAQLSPLLPFAQHYTLVHAPQVIHMHEHPTKALKEKPQSSIAIGFKLLAEGKIDAFISAGNTGAILVGALYSLKAMEGVLRPAISTLVPKEDGSTGLLLDVGLNANCRPEHLNQFAIMGTVYAQQILGIPNPRVALLNIGEEEGKGNTLAQATYSLLNNNQRINFAGNAEGRDVLVNKADIMVCDGFTGNIILKMAESLYGITKRKGITHNYFDLFNSENYGGTPVLGISKPVIIGHGISHANAFKNMIGLAVKMIEKEVMLKMKTELIG